MSPRLHGVTADSPSTDWTPATMRGGNTGTARVRREGSLVTLQLNVDSWGAEAQTVLIPPGFRPAMLGVNTSIEGWVFFASGLVDRPGSGRHQRPTFIYFTADPMPT